MIEAIVSSHFYRVLPLLFEGVTLTLFITVVGIFFGFILGCIAGLGRLSKNKFIYGIATGYVEVIRGTPIIAQVLFLHFGLSDLVGINLPAVASGCIAIAVNAGAYIAEVVRGAVQSIDRGQMEAGRSIGLTHAQTMRYIIWPQAFKRMIPPLGNQIIISLKDTSLFSVISVGELLYKGRQYASTTFTYFEPYLMIMIMYLCITIPAMLYLRRLERRLDV